MFDLLQYDASTGEFTWIKSPSNNVKAGTLAGGISHRGYRYIRVNMKQYLAHRLAWLFYYGKWPSGEIDHINGIKTDNRISNLRDVSHSVNKQNLKKARSDNVTGLIGVSPHCGKYRSYIAIGGKRLYLGHYDTAEEAHKVYIEAKRKLHEGNTL